MQSKQPQMSQNLFSAFDMTSSKQFSRWFHGVPAFADLAQERLVQRAQLLSRCSANLEPHSEEEDRSAKGRGIHSTRTLALSLAIRSVGFLGRWGPQPRAGTSALLCKLGDARRGHCAKGDVSRSELADSSCELPFHFRGCHSVA